MILDLSQRELIVIMTALKELETNLEENLPHIAWLTPAPKEQEILLESILLLEDCKEMQTDFCLRISSLK